MANTELQEQLQAAKLLRAIKQSRSSLMAYTKYTMPDPQHYDDPDFSKFEDEAHHRLLGEALEKVERGELMRLAISMPPQHGKSEIASRRFPSWYMGRNPHKNLMLGTYNQDFANIFGGQVREIVTSERHKKVFPDFQLSKGSKARDYMATMADGKMSFLGRGGAGTGKPADLFLIDDPLKDDIEAQSNTIRSQLWEWFTKVAFTRCHIGTPIVIIHTRWHEDDLIGRLCDPGNPHYDPEIGKLWTYINIPAEIHDKAMAKALGKKPGDALWPKRFPISHLNQIKRMNPRGYSALYMGKPSPDDGDYFKREWLLEYERHELPTNLRKYCASDHAISSKQENDPSCFGTVGVDEDGDLWVMPDLYWEREDDTNVLVDEMIAIMQNQRPQTWWAENGQISKTILPFLKKRMKEKHVYVYVDISMTPSTDKKARARSIQGMMSLQRVHFPKFAPWWMNAKNELLKFPNGAHDDFVDFLAWIGIGINKVIGAPKEKEKKSNVTPIGSLRWIKEQTKAEERIKRLTFTDSGRLN